MCSFYSGAYMVLPPPPHFDNILLTIVTTKLSAIHVSTTSVDTNPPIDTFQYLQQSTNVPKLSVSVTDSFPKHHGEFTDIYHGDLLAETPNTTISVVCR